MGGEGEHGTKGNNNVYINKSNEVYINKSRAVSRTENERHAYLKLTLRPKINA